MGSNMAEAHPVGFRFPMQAKAKGAKILHVDPRFTRTSALADMFVGIRAGSDIAFLGGLIHHILSNDLWFKEYVLAYTNASTIIESRFQDTEDLAGLFSGYDPESHEYDPAAGHWGYEKFPEQAAEEVLKEMEEGEGDGGGDQAKHQKGSAGIHGPSMMGGASTHTSKQSSATEEPGGGGPRDETLQDPHCVMQLLRKHFARYTPEWVAQCCGCTPEQVVEVAETLAANSGPERTSAICYAVGWTQHTTGVQIIRAAGILQALLGNMGRPGGGILALRGHASIQGSTDIPTLYDMLPGYLAQPIADPKHEQIDSYVSMEGLETGYWANYKEFVVSLLKAWYGEAAQQENDYRFAWIPRINQDYSLIPYCEMMAKGEVDGYFLFGQNPAAGASNGRLVRQGLRTLKWMVCLDWFETETATFWKNDPTAPPSNEIGTEVFFIPAAPAPCKEGTLTNTERLIQWHDKALDPDGDSRSDAWFVYNLGKKLRELYKDSIDPRDAPLLNLTWDYDFEETPRLPDGTLSRIAGEPDTESILKEINGYHLDAHDPKTGKRKLLSGFSDCKADGTTSCGCWVYSGIFPEHDHNRARDRKRTDTPVQSDWAYSWPHNRRILYNRASARPDGTPWSERKKYLWWDAEQAKWTGHDEPDFEPDKPPTYRPSPDSKGMDAIGGADPFIMKPDGRAWLYAPGGAKDGPLPTHYEPVESPIANPLHRKQQENPTLRYFEGPLNPIAHGPENDYPIVACTFRVTEHYLSGPMSRFNSWLNELMPAMFVEISPELAEEKGIEHGGWLTVISARGEIEAKAMVTRRVHSMQVEGRTIHQIGVPFHWGYAGEAVGSIANDMTYLVADANVSMHEAKVFACDVRAGRTPNQPTQPTQPMTRWPDRSDIPDTPPAAQPEGHMKKKH
jgi:formate dehydrogenase major subunit